jgi:hypothetical protein
VKLLLQDSISRSPKLLSETRYLNTDVNTLAAISEGSGGMAKGLLATADRVHKEHDHARLDPASERPERGCTHNSIGFGTLGADA